MAEVDSLRQLLLDRFPVLRDAPALLLSRLLESAPIRAPAGTVLFDPKMSCEGFPLVLEGSVRVSTMSPEGREIVLYRVTPGEGCILSGSCLLSDSNYSALGVAETELLLLRVSRELFQELMLHAESFRRFVFGLYGNRLAEVIELVEEVAFRKLDTRLARLLVQRGPILEVTHQALADELGSVRVIISRLLRSFEERGWVKLERERITVTDLRGLAEFVRS